MEEDRIPLSPRRAHTVVIETRAKFDSLLDEALSKKRRSKNRRQTRESDAMVGVAKSASGDSTSIDNPPRIAPRQILAPIGRHAASTVSGQHPGRNLQERKGAGLEESSRSLQESRNVGLEQDTTVVTIEHENATSEAETSFTTKLTTRREHLSPSRMSEKTETIKAAPKRRSRKKEKENIELQPVASKVPSHPGNEESDACLAVLMHGTQLPCSVVPRSLTVRVHVVDVEAGRELHLSEQSPVTPQATHKITNIRGRFAVIDEEVIFPVSLRLALENTVVLFFEILSPAAPTTRVLPCYTGRTEAEERCVGWSFLKLRGANNHVNCDTKLRLQLYEPLTSNKRLANQDFNLVHSWWCKGPWRKTTCSMYVTVHGTVAAGTTRQDSGQLDLKQDEPRETQDGDDSPSRKDKSTAELQPDWLRRKEQLCRVTSKLHMSLPMCTSNCLALAFSASGNLLACAATHNTIHIYQVPGFTSYCSLVGHQGLIYSLAWYTDAWLISASSDCTVIMWNMSKQQLSMVLPHPTFVYCCQFLPGSRGQGVVTGGKDQIIRVWCQPNQDADFDLWQELEGHAGYITSLCFNKHGQLFSADSEGQILMWTRDSQDWKMLKEVVVTGLRGTCVTCLQPHPRGSRLLVHARDSLLRMVDVASGAVVQQYLGALSHKVQTGAYLSPCGSLVMAGGEEGTVTLWQAETGSLLNHCEPPTSLSPPATALCYHPRAHLMVSGYFGHPATPVRVWVHDAEHKVEDTAAAQSKSSLVHKAESDSTAGDQLRLQDIIARIDQVLSNAA